MTAGSKSRAAFGVDRVEFVAAARKLMFTMATTWFA